MASIEFESDREVLCDVFDANYADWHKMPPDKWAEGVRRMPGVHGSLRRFTFDFAPYEREPFLAIFDKSVREVVLRWFSRGGKSEVILNALGYFISETPKRINVMWPTVGQAEKWSKDNLLGELIRPTPVLNELLGEDSGRRKSGNTILHKSYPGGLINIFGANAPGEVRRAKGEVGYSDEIDAIEESETDEGDILFQFDKRCSEYPDAILIKASYPSLKHQSRISARLADTDCRKWFVPCLKCGDPWIMHRRDLRYDKEKPETARIECPNCHELHDDAARYKMSRLPEKWTPTKEFKGKAGFDANSMLWPHPVDPLKYPGGFLQMLAQREIDAERSDNPERARRVIVNQEDAEDYEPEHLQKIEHSNLYRRRESYDPREELPVDVVFICFGADLQSNRVEIKFKGFGLKLQEVTGVASGGAAPVKQSWAIDYRIVRGSPLQNEFWEKFENVLRNVAWKHPSGEWIRPSIGLLDASYRPDEVFSFVRKLQKLRVYGVEGAEQLGKPIIPKKPIKRGVPPAFVWEVGTHEAKDIIYQQLEISDPTKQGYMHFPAVATFSEGYFKQLTIEESMMQRARDGNFYRFFFKKSSDDRNEPLDCEVYADAAERIYRPNYEKLIAELVPQGTSPTPDPNENPDKGLPQFKHRISKSGGRWMSGFGKI